MTASNALRINYRPPGLVARAFLRDPSFVCGIRGPIGSGKTTACIIKAMGVSGMQPKNAQGVRRSRGAIIRNTYPELRTTTIKSWHEWVPQSIGKWQSEGPPTHYVQGGDGLEAEVLFLALDRPEDVRKLLSLELTWAYVNEAREAPKAIIDGLTGRVGRFPSARDGGCVSPQIIMDTNSPDSDHWWYRLAEEDQPDGFAFYSQPGGRMPGAENLAWLNQTAETLALLPGDARRLAQGRKYYERAAHGKDADWIKVYIDNEYGFVRDGRPVYHEYSDAVHCKAFELDHRHGLRIGLDFGLTPAATIGSRTPTGAWRVRHEIVTERMGATELARTLAQFLAERYPDRAKWKIASITGDPAGEGGGNDDQTVFEILRANGIAGEPAHTNNFAVRRDAVGQAMSRLIDGAPGFLLHPDCRTLRKACGGGYRFKRVAVAGEERYRDAPDKNSFSHVAEAMQYMMLGGGAATELVRAAYEVESEPAPEYIGMPGGWMR